MCYSYAIAVLLIVVLPTIAQAQPSGAEALAFSGPAWSPYVVGALIGGLTMLTFYFSNKPLGASTAYARAAGMLGMAFASRHTQSLKFYKDHKPAVEWEVMLVIGVAFGAFLAAWQGGELTGQWVPPMWEDRFGENIAARLAVALVGGALMAFGARLAGGCTSGHGISGTLQLSVGSWIALISLFASGIATAMLVYRF